MKNRYKRKAWYLDEDVLLYGNIDKRGFHPEKGLPCGFGTQVVNKKAKNKTWFYSLEKAKKVLGPTPIMGGTFSLAVDVGFTVTKVVCNKDIGDNGSQTFSFNTADVISDANNVTNEEFCDIVARVLNQMGYVDVSYLRTKLMAFVSEEQNEAGTYETTIQYNNGEYHMLMTFGKVQHSFYATDKDTSVVLDKGHLTIDMFHVTKRG